ncbi:dipeptidase [Mucilaginibacter phyllosphaerae]|uniref:Membrane dipeptidase n=1 Tax=Mucilaginibacter phyllosphaerae TaxID=1812349 RepID=A0A4Y8A789_9SPHI|nr:dipeptidase [Mucilaginibacter phyllosphaerae]MBB3970813.1 membrane dipeptidase [Mucilaginibacter phyllosphaerae]TEW64248.1 membrane dipeptidase [Mucilaginibacter phyllosphaerae]GGH04775.1 membrane dipeptidase [Mucilaginibacter phyllosphaerae]
MKKLLLPLFLFSTLAASAQNVKQIHQRAILIDTHNDALSNQLITKVDLGKRQTEGNFDLPRARQGGLDVQVFSVWCGDQYGNGNAYAYANREIDSLYALIKRYPAKIQLVRTAADLRKTVTQKKLAAMIGVEGGHMIEDRLDYIDSLAKRGMSYLTLTWNNSTSWATSARDETLHSDSLPHKGLTDLGKQVVQRLNKLGVMIDLSHPGEQTFKDVMALTTKPVIASHSCVYALNPHRRNLKDYQLKAIAKNEGVVFLNFYSGFIDSTYNNRHEAYLARHKPEMDSLIKVYNDYDLASIRLNAINKTEADQFRPPLSMLIKHIDYMVKMIGADHVGIGSDFDGAESYPLGLDSVLDYPKITAELLKLNYSEKDIDKILGGNFIRVLKANVGK